MPSPGCGSASAAATSSGGWRATCWRGSTAPEREEIATGAVERAADAVEAFVGDGIDAMMNRFNRKPEAARETADGATRESEPAGPP